MFPGQLAERMPVRKTPMPDPLQRGVGRSSFFACVWGTSARCASDGVCDHILLQPSKKERKKQTEPVIGCASGPKGRWSEEPVSLLGIRKAGYLEGNVIFVLLDAW